ncbi:uncharacterized protein ACIBXB_008410 isoform 2-T2 [Morphnus guianensis]
MGHCLLSRASQGRWQRRRWEDRCGAVETRTEQIRSLERADAPMLRSLRLCVSEAVFGFSGCTWSLWAASSTHLPARMRDSAAGHVSSLNTSSLDSSANLEQKPQGSALCHPLSCCGPPALLSRLRSILWLCSAPRHSRVSGMPQTRPALLPLRGYASPGTPEPVFPYPGAGSPADERWGRGRGLFPGVRPPWR